MDLPALFDATEHTRGAFSPLLDSLGFKYALALFRLTVCVRKLQSPSHNLSSAQFQWLDYNFSPAGRLTMLEVNWGSLVSALISQVGCGDESLKHFAAQESLRKSYTETWLRFFEKEEKNVFHYTLLVHVEMALLLQHPFIGGLFHVQVAERRRGNDAKGAQGLMGDRRGGLARGHSTDGWRVSENRGERQTGGRAGHWHVDHLGHLLVDEGQAWVGDLRGFSLAVYTGRDAVEFRGRCHVIEQQACKVAGPLHRCQLQSRLGGIQAALLTTLLSLRGPLAPLRSLGSLLSCWLFMRTWIVSTAAGRSFRFNQTHMLHRGAGSTGGCLVARILPLAANKGSFCHARAFSWKRDLRRAAQSLRPGLRRGRRLRGGGVAENIAWRWTWIHWRRCVNIVAWPTAAGVAWILALRWGVSLRVEGHALVLGLFGAADLRRRDRLGQFAELPLLLLVLVRERADRRQRRLYSCAREASVALHLQPFQRAAVNRTAARLPLRNLQLAGKALRWSAPQGSVQGPGHRTRLALDPWVRNHRGRALHHLGAGQTSTAAALSLGITERWGQNRMHASSR